MSSRACLTRPMREAETSRFTVENILVYHSSISLTVPVQKAKGKIFRRGVDM